jgi:hypothetical protein
MTSRIARAFSANLSLNSIFNHTDAVTAHVLSPTYILLGSGPDGIVLASLMPAPFYACM